jgi:methylenetetrahydrofolate--tRNA-(uracil-5-)-methyltransferase
LNAARHLRGEPLLELPRETMLGSLCHYVSHAEPRRFQPMKANFGLLPALDGPRVRDRRERQRKYAARSEMALEDVLASSIQDS